MLSRIDRYVFREVLGPLALGFFVYTLILLLNALFKSAELIIRRGLPVSAIGELLLLSMPSILVLTVPMSLLFGILIAVGRLSADSELVALRSSGVSLMRLCRPILLLASMLTLVNMVLSLWALPWGNHRLALRKLEISVQGAASMVQPRVFHQEWSSNQVLYVFEVPENDTRWRGVFVAEAVPVDDRSEVIVADWGQLRVDEAGERVVLELTNATIHEYDPSSPLKYQASRNATMTIELEDRFLSKERARVSTTKTVRELTLPELNAWARDPVRTREERRLARVELHKKLAIPAACLVFGIVALPLGFNNRRGGKASGFALSMLVILVYWVLLNTGEESARVGRMSPVVAMWAPNVLLLLLGLVLLVRRNRDRGLFSRRVDRWLQEDLPEAVARALAWVRLRLAGRRMRQRVQKEGQTSPQVVIRLSRVQPRFPNLLDRYVGRIFSTVFFFTLLSGLVLYVVADLTENASSILKNQVPTDVLFSYYQYLSLEMFFQISPILVLVTTLITFSLLGRNSEITAAKALGISVYRLALPALVGAAVVTGLAAYLQAQVLPAANQRVAELHAQIKGETKTKTYRRADRQWLFGQDRYIYNYRRYDPATRSLDHLQVFEFDAEHRLTGRVLAEKATYDSTGLWDFAKGWSRRFDGAQVTEYNPFPTVVKARYPEKPEFFDSEIRPPEQMSFGELSSYVAELEKSGQAVTELRVQLHGKIAYPAISIVMALVALPFAFRLGRQGALYGIGLSLVLGMAFLAVYAFFTTLGEAGVLPPVVAVWSPNTIFALWAAYLFLGVRT